MILLLVAIRSVDVGEYSGVLEDGGEGCEEGNSELEMDFDNVRGLGGVRATCSVGAGEGVDEVSRGNWDWADSENDSSAKSGEPENSRR